jgi:LacI family transcriptional regulator
MSEQKSDSKTKVTIADVAKASGVSPATVSLVLRNKAGVGSKTRQQVINTAQSMGYIHKPSLTSQKRSLLSSMGLIIRTRPDDPLSANEFYAPVLSGIEYACRQKQINLMYTNLPVDEHNRPLQTPQLLTNEQLDGFLLVGMCLDEAMTAVIQKHDKPVVLVDAYSSQARFDAVVTNNFDGAYEAVTHLVQLGHQQIAIVGSQADSYPSISERRAGYLQALADHNLQPHFIDCPLDPDAAQPATAVYLQQHSEVTAVFGCNDKVAIAAMKAAAAVGRLIPDNLAVMGFDNIPLSQHVIPALSTMRIDKMGMGRTAVHLLENRIEFPTSGIIQAVIQPQLFERHSTTTH